MKAKALFHKITILAIITIFTLITAATRAYAQGDSTAAPQNPANTNQPVKFEHFTTESGLNRYDPQGRRFNLYRSDPANPNSLSSSFVMSLYDDEQDVLWIGTMGAG